MSVQKVNSIIDASKSYEYVDNGSPKQGGVKDVYFSPDKKYVVAFYRDKKPEPTPIQKQQQKERIVKIVSTTCCAFRNLKEKRLSI